MDSSAALPPGWEVQYSNTYKRNYFFNSVTGESKWHHPGAGGKDVARQNATISDATRRECDPAPQLSADRAPNEPNRAQMVAPAAPAPRAAAAPAAAPPPASSSAVKGGGFLSTLLKQREAMLAKSEAVKTTKTSYERAWERYNAELDEFRERMKVELRAFADDEGRTELHCAPAPKDRRQIVHQLSVELGLLTRSEGDDAERHVAAYKPGCEPPEMRMPEEGDAVEEELRRRAEERVRVVANQQRRQRELEAKRKQLERAAPKEVVAVGQAIKDTRTVQQYLEDRKRGRDVYEAPQRKRQNLGGGGSRAVGSGEDSQ